MVEATSQTARLQSQIIKAFDQIQYQSVPPTAQRGPATAPTEVVTALVKAKGKEFSADAKKCPPEVKSVQNKVSIEEAGFTGQKVGDTKTGKAKQWHTGGAYFDGFMLENELVRGRFYFANGDFF